MFQSAIALLLIYAPFGSIIAICSTWPWRPITEFDRSLTRNCAFSFRPPPFFFFIMPWNTFEKPLGNPWPIF